MEKGIADPCHDAGQYSVLCQKSGKCDDHTAGSRQDCIAVDFIRKQAQRCLHGEGAEIIKHQAQRPLPGVQKAAVNEKGTAEVHTKMSKRIDTKHI